jgi:hypothetical protein
VHANNLFGLLAFLSVAFVAFRQLRVGEPPVRLFSVRSVPFAFIFWIGAAAGIWDVFPPKDMQDLARFEILGVVETTLALIASVYVIVCLARRK